MGKKFNYIDLFAGAGGLSEGFIRAGYKPIAHVEMDAAACYTLKTRIAYHHLKENGKVQDYISYLSGKIDREQLYGLIPSHKLESVFNLAISPENNPKIFKGIDVQLNGDKVDLIIGGPPCQAYSLVGRARSIDGMQSDPRNYLFEQYAEYLKKYKPKIFVFENVLGLKSAGGGKYFAEMRDLFDKIGYKVADFVVEADKYGVLQKRKRVILIGQKKTLKLELPDISVVSSKPYWVKDIFDDLPELTAGDGDDKNGKYITTKVNNYLLDNHIRNGIEVLTQHVCRPHTPQDKEIYRRVVELWNKKKERLSYDTLPERLRTHKNVASFFDRFKVVAQDVRSAQTVVAHIAKDGHYYIHPDIKQNRSISVREAARLQSFPDDYYFEGVKEGKNRTAAFKQIGNAVPPLMAYQIAKNISSTLL